MELTSVEKEVIGLIKQGMISRHVARVSYGVNYREYTKLRKIAIPQQKARRRPQERNTTTYEHKCELSANISSAAKDIINSAKIGETIEFEEITREHSYTNRKYRGVVCQKNSWCLFVRGKSGRIKSIKLGDLVAGDIKVLGVSG